MRLPPERGLPEDGAWVCLDGDPAGRRWRIAGNAHTHRGHFHVEDADGGTGTANLADVVKASPLARAWLSGFVQGQEPSQFEFLGHDDDLLESADTDDDARWFAWNTAFRERGHAPSLAFLPRVTASLCRVTDPVPWVLVGGLFRVVHDGTWVVADPHPVEATLETWAWPGSACERRGHHSLEQLDDVVTVCEDCHLVLV